MSGLGFIVMGAIFIGVGILGLTAGLIILGRKKQRIKEEQIQEEGL